MRPPRRSLRRNVPEGMHVWFLEGFDPAGHKITGYILTTEDSRYWIVTDEAKNWSMGRRNVRGELLSPPHHPAVPWDRAGRVEPGDERYPAYADELIPGQVRIADWEWGITQPIAREKIDSGRRWKDLITGQFLGIVVNPKLMKPALAVMQHDDYVHILRMDVEGFPDEGQGNYQSGCRDDFSEMGYGWPCDVSGCVRVHTAHGVKTRRAGYGTALYTSLALGAHLEIMPGEYKADCISSGDIEGHGRSDAAQKWWRDNSPPNLDYAEAHTTEGEVGGEGGDDDWEDYRETEVDLTRSLKRYVIGRFVSPEEAGLDPDVDTDLENLDLTTELKEYIEEREVGDWDDMVTYVNTIRVDVAVEEDENGEKRFKVVNVRVPVRADLIRRCHATHYTIGA